jgi:hypothetical protein
MTEETSNISRSTARLRGWYQDATRSHNDGGVSCCQGAFELSQGSEPILQLQGKHILYTEYSQRSYIQRQMPCHNSR